MASGEARAALEGIVPDAGEAGREGEVGRLQTMFLAELRFEMDRWVAGTVSVQSLLLDNTIYIPSDLRAHSPELNRLIVTGCRRSSR